MSSKKKLGIFFVSLGTILIFKRYFPEFYQSVLDFISFPVILVILGLYLIVTKETT